jgi:hypothetical protein
MHVWFHDNVNKLIRMWVLFFKSLNDMRLNRLNVGIAQCSF